MIPDPVGLILGTLSLAVMYLLWKHCEDLEDGNIDTIGDGR